MPRRLVPALILACACGGGGGGGDPIDARDDGFDRRALLEQVGAHLGATYDGFATEAAALTGAIDTWCGALGGAGADAARADAQAAWRTTIDAWQAADAVLLGTAAASMKTQRNRIYSWPLINSCAVDHDVATRWADPDSYDVTSRLDNRRSLAAVEYLLFTESLESVCPEGSPPPGWDALSDADRLTARCEIAAIIAGDVAAQGALVRDAWPADLAALTGAASLQESVNVVSDAFFYVDKMVKDMKLGESSGIAINSCGTVEEPCLAEVEHRPADHAKPAMLANLRSLHAAFTGTVGGEDGAGFDDFLSAVGAADVSTRMLGELDDGIAAVEAIDGTFLEALEADYDGVVAAHAAIKLFTDDLKSQFLTVLGLEIPDDVAGDND
jgi:predicted lipoprotein